MYGRHVFVSFLFTILKSVYSVQCRLEYGPGRMHNQNFHLPEQIWNSLIPRASHFSFLCFALAPLSFSFHWPVSLFFSFLSPLGILSLWLYSFWTKLFVLRSALLPWNVDRRLHSSAKATIEPTIRKCMLQWRTPLNRVRNLKFQF